MKKVLNALLTITAFSFLSCTHMTKEEKLAEFMNDPAHHIVQKQVSNGVSMTVKYMPVEYQKRMDRDKLHNGKEFLQNILLDVKIGKIGMKKDKATEMYLNFDIQNDFQLEAGNSLLIPAICQKIENGIKDNYEYLVVFESAALENSPLDRASLVYSDKIFGIGERKFIFRKNDILTIPRLTDN